MLSYRNSKGYKVSLNIVCIFYYGKCGPRFLFLDVLAALQPSHISVDINISIMVQYLV